MSNYVVLFAWLAGWLRLLVCLWCLWWRGGFFTHKNYLTQVWLR